MRTIATLVLLLLAAAPLARADGEAYPHGRLPDGVAPTHYRLALTVDPRREEFSGRADIDITVTAPTATIWLHGLGLRMQEVSVSQDGHRLAARYEEVDHESGVARVVLAAPLPRGAAVLHFRYRAPFQSAAQGLYRTRAGDDWYAFTQFEAIDARRVYPGFDEPRFKTPFDLSVTTLAGDVAISNTPQRRAVKLGAGTRHDFATTRPLPTYLIAFAVGPLDVSATVLVPPNAVRREPLPLRLVGTRGQAGRFAYALREAPALIERLEAYFGIGFPYPKIDLIASPIHGGAMENAGAIIFADDLLLFAANPTPRQQSNFGTTAAHELAHQWFGDLVTPAWWDDIWLNESFAEWMGSKIANEWRPDLGIAQEQLEGTLGAMATDALASGRAVHQPVTDNRQIGVAFDEITYQKGAGVIGMIESYLGPERFQRGVRQHLGRHRYGTATATDFFAAMAEASGEPAIIDAFRSFIDRPGVPLVTVRAAPDGSLALEQSRYRPLGAVVADGALWKIPFCVAVHGAAATAKACTLLTERTGTLALPPAGDGDAIVHPNADGAGYYRFAIDGAPLRALVSIGATLPAREALALADSAAAAFEAGRLGFAELYNVATVLARHPDRTTALDLGYRLDDLHDRVATAETRPLLEHALVALYGERLRSLGYDLAPGRYAGEPAEQQLLRRQLIGLVGLSGRDPEVRRALADAAERALADPATVELLFRWRIWAIAAEDLGLPVVSRLYALAGESRDAAVRDDATSALGYGDTPEVSQAELAAALDPRFDFNIAFSILGQQIIRPQSRATAWSWLAAHRDAVVERVPVMFQGQLAWLGGSFCEPAERQAFESVLAARLRPAGGGSIEVDRALERIDDCIALRQAVGDSLRTTLAPAARP